MMQAASGEILDTNRYREINRQLTAVVAIGQLLGSIALLLIPLLALKIQSPYKWIAVGLALSAFFFVFLFFWFWFDVWWNLVANALFVFPTVEPIAAANRNRRLVDFSRWLFVADTGILFAIIRLTGGFGHSPFDAVLPLLPVIAIIILQPRKTIIWALQLQVAFTLLALVHGASHMAQTTSVFAKLHRWEPQWLDASYEKEKDSRYPFVFIFVAFGSIGLSFIEYYVTHGSNLKSRGLKGRLGKAAVLVPELKEIGPALDQGIAEWKAWLEANSLPINEISSVHDSLTVAHQSLILSIPLWEGNPSRRKSLIKNLTFTTYAAHWIDDQFDPSNRYLRNGGHDLPPESVFQTFPLVRELASRIQGFLPLESRRVVDVAIKRIVFGAHIQNADTKNQYETALRDYRQLLAEHWPDGCDMSAIDDLSLWTTSKLVLELFEGAAPNFSQAQSETLNLLYGPLLYYQDLNLETELEHFGRYFREIIEDQPKVVAAFRTTINLVINKYVPQTFGSNGLPEVRRMQLAALYYAYSSKLPAELQVEYQAITKSSIERQLHSGELECESASALSSD